MWLLEASVLKALEVVQRTAVMPTVDQQTQFEASHFASDSDSNSRILKVVGDTAQISIKGVITETPSFLAFLFGGGNTTYGEIISALAQANSDPAIKNIILAIDSPGGTVDGLFDTLSAIQLTGKPITAVTSNICASAAFAIACQADTITASNIATRFGSVGILGTFSNDPSTVEITSTNAPNKRPDVTTPEGINTVRVELDAMHDIFVDSIATGRDTTTDNINANFGRGSMLLAGEALKRGMIDSIADKSFSAENNTQPVATALDGGVKSETVKMTDVTIESLRTQHPDVYSAAVKIGTIEERERVNAHLIYGVQCGAMDTAVKACEDGSPLTAVIQAKYMTAGMNRKDVADRQDDDLNANAGDDIKPDDKSDPSKGVVGLVSGLMGVTMGDS